MIVAYITRERACTHAHTRTHAQSKTERGEGEGVKDKKKNRVGREHPSSGTQQNHTFTNSAQMWVRANTSIPTEGENIQYEPAT